MQPIKRYLREKLDKRYADCELSFSSNNPGKDKGIKATRNSPGNRFEERSIVRIQLTTFWTYALLFLLCAGLIGMLLLLVVVGNLLASFCGYYLKLFFSMFL